MSWFGNLANKFGYVRYKDGSHFYQLQNGNTTYLNGQDKLDIATGNPVAGACIQIRANMLSKVRWYQEDSNGEKVFDSPELELLNNPNAHQSKQDFLRQYEWYKSAYGWVYQKPYGSVGFQTDAIFNLRPSYVVFPDKMQSAIVWGKQDVDKFYKQKIKYEEPNQTVREFELRDVMMFYDIANGLNKNNSGHADAITSPSKIDSSIKSISNVGLALDAENVIIQTNGREIYSSDATGGNLGSSLPMDKDDKKDIDEKLINKYRVGFGGRRAITTNRPIKWTPTHIKLADLGFKDSLATNANLITQSFGVPNELYKAFQKGDTFENQEKALIGFVQNVTQPTADDLANTWNSYFELANPIKASFDHIPAMSKIEDEKANKILKIAMAFEKLQRAGMSEDGIADIFQSQGINIINELND